MILAEDLGTGGWFGVVGMVIAFFVAVGGFVIAYFNNATRLLKRVDDLTTRMFDLQDEASKCREREADLKAEMARMGRRIHDLEKVSGEPLGLLSVTGIIVANLKGIIREFSPALTPILHYLPEEVTGKSIEMFVPPELMEKHRVSFALAAENPDLIDPTRPVITYAVDKQGMHVPVVINLHGWREGDQGLITATIKQRAASSESGRHAPFVYSDPDVPERS